MAYADPQSVNPGGGAVSLPRTGMAVTEGTFTAADDTLTMKVAHTRGRRIRHLVRVDLSKVSTDPLVPDQNIRSSASVHIVIDRPVNGISAAEAKVLADGLVAWAAASTGANLTKLVGFEV